VISLAGRPVGPPDPKNPTALRGPVGVWNCESSDRIWQMLALRGLPGGKSGQTKLQITPDQLAKITGPANAPQRQQWPRSAVADVRVDPESDSKPPSLSLHFNDGKPPVCILSGPDPAELNWIAEEIHIKWGMASTDSVAPAGS